MDKQELRLLLMPAFIEELRECVGDMHRHLQSLQQNPEQTVREMLVNEVYRAAHKMKGAANAVEVGSIEQLCRQMQKILITVRDGQRTIDSELYAQFFEAITFLMASEASLREGKDPQPSASIFKES